MEIATDAPGDKVYDLKLKNYFWGKSGVVSEPIARHSQNSFMILAQFPCGAPKLTKKHQVPCK